MKNLIFLITLTFCIFSCTDEECNDKGEGCASWQECSAHKCLDKPKPAPTPTVNPAGTQVVSCNCAYTTDAPGTIRSDTRCASSQSVAYLCNGCCTTNTHGTCVGFPWGRICR